MRWVRARVPQACGRVDCCWVNPGDPLQILEGGANPLTHPKFRCQQHADGPVDWQQIAEDDARQAAAAGATRAPQQPTMTEHERKGQLPFDGKAAAAGE